MLFGNLSVEGLELRARIYCRLGVVWIDPGLSVIQPSEGMIMDVVFSHGRGYHAFGVYVLGGLLAPGKV